MVMPGVGLTRGQRVGGDARGGASFGAGLTQSRLGAGVWPCGEGRWVVVPRVESAWSPTPGQILG